MPVAETEDISCFMKNLLPLPPSLQEYEKLAAKLDGAKTDLTKKVNEMSKAAAKEDIVEAAEDHARNLTRMADELEKYDV